MVQTLQQKLQALSQLLRTYGPYRREQLRLQLLSKASLLRDEALKVAITAEKLARLGPRPTSVANSPASLETAAAELEELARTVARWPASAD
ncbi:MAG TPA: hypothetical protein VFU23_11575 [Gemmatimonadales bacterium]|nr:hypothetical protein [Gemmatimonadales bacterium]